MYRLHFWIILVNKNVLNKIGQYINKVLVSNGNKYKKRRKNMEKIKRIAFVKKEKVETC